MNTECAVGKVRIRFESQARRRWLVALFYAMVAAFGFAPFSAHPDTRTVWIVGGFGVLFAALFLVFTWIAGDPRIRGDERETHRRDHAHYVAYRMLLYGFLAVCFYYFVAIPIARSFLEPNPSALFLRVVLSGSLRQHFLFIAIYFLFGSLPQAVLLWTEPDIDQAE
jgi:hypothetical protein